jgi:hypothetical protein
MFRPDLLGEQVQYPEAQHPTDNIKAPSHEDGNLTLERGAKGMSGVVPSEQMEGAPMRQELNLRGPSFADNFYKVQDNLSPSAFHASKNATEETAAQQFLFLLKQVLGTFTASCIGMFQSSQRPVPFDGQAGEHKVNLGEFASASTYDPSGKFNTSDLAVSRIQGIADALKADEIRDALDAAWAQAAVWCDDENGFLYEVYASGYSFDPKTLDFVFKYITGKKGDLKLAKQTADIAPTYWNQEPKDPKEEYFEVMAPIYDENGEEISKLLLSGHMWSESEANGRAFHYEFDVPTMEELKKLTRSQINDIEDIIDDLLKGATGPKQGALGVVQGSYTEFDQSYAVPDDVPTTFKDDTWSNDTCPSFINEAGDQKLWIEHPDPLKREDPDPAMKRFTLTDADDRSKVIFESDDWDQMKQKMTTASEKTAVKVQKDHSPR